MRWLLLAVLLAACGPVSGTSADAGHRTTSDAGPADGGWTRHEILKDTFCSCPGETAIRLTNMSGTQAAEWSQSFAPVTLGPNDHLYLLFDFSGPATWNVTLKDAEGNDAFPTSGIPVLDNSIWHCIFVDYSLQQNDYSITIDDTGAGASMSATFPTTVAGVHVKYTGNGNSNAWLDSVVIEHLSGANEEVIFQEAFDDPSLSAGALSGSASITAPPSSVTAPLGFCQ